MYKIIVNLVFGANELVHGLLVWPSSEEKQLSAGARWIGILPALGILILGGIALVATYRW